MITEIEPKALAETRMAVYRFLLAALDKPAAAQHAWFASADFRAALIRLGGAFGLAPPEGELAAADPADHESRYISCFEVGVPEPPVPLLASHYHQREPVPHIVREHILFYRAFGVRVAAANIEPADHLLHELAFLIHLDRRLLAGAGDPGQVRQGRQDFLTRHAALWPAQAAARARDKDLPAVYQSLLSLLAAAVAQDKELTAALSIGPEAKQ